MATRAVEITDPRTVDGDTEQVLEATRLQATDVAQVTATMVDDLEWATRNVVMDDAMELDRLDGLPSYAVGTPAEGGRDPLSFWEVSDEAGLLARIRGAVGVLLKLTQDLRTLRDIPLADRYKREEAVAPLPPADPEGVTAMLPGPA